MYIPACASQSADCPTWDEAAKAAAFLYRFGLDNARQVWHVYVHRHTNARGQQVWGVWTTKQPTGVMVR
ncbi:hypothetical protein [Actinopolymorpha alba]|uniref:hypothetical protein n=1 Tax=Actinopolymorpha alba TaxID=533267 RepID=UPI00035FDB17|nr:hypothetical protein [Actinopolymorpha alba]